MATTKLSKAADEFDWIKLSEHVNTPTETFLEKLQRKVGENPFVPMGALGAFGALSYGLWSMKNHDVKMSQYMMRTRVAAQGFAVAALIIGTIYSNTK